jgi:large-conductance mechanosensitive channel
MIIGFLIYLTQIFIIIKLLKMRRRKRGRKVSRNYTIARGGIRL